ncbi:MAG TPA: hypothetical protein VGC39_01510 [Candidatus Methylacidiphilales bacterium]
MNDENLEQHLRNLPALELPEAWRAQILSKAVREARTLPSRQTWPALLVYLRHLFRRNPVTASAMAALWMLIFIFKAATPVDSGSQMLLAHIDPHQPIHLMSIPEEIRLAELLQDQSEQRPIP